ncbi:MAG: NUDIX domain-containing protein [Oscillospiraceae bacterium]
MQKEKSCGAVVSRNCGGQHLILLIKHKNGGHWAFPKGHVEGEEQETETAAREIWEETGLSAKINTGFRAVVTYSPKKNVIKDVIYFAAVANSGDPIAQPGEVEKIQWVTPAQAFDVVSYENDREVLRKYIRFIHE